MLAKCVEELKMKGVEFDLLKEVDALRRATSLKMATKHVRKQQEKMYLEIIFEICRTSTRKNVLNITRTIL